MIYHVTHKAHWQKALDLGFYEADSLQLEGFIHTSSITQVKAVLERYYKDEENLLLLHIDEDRLKAPLKYELAPSVNEMFPHVYGPVNLDAVVKTEAL